MTKAPADCIAKKFKQKMVKEIDKFLIPKIVLLVERLASKYGLELVKKTRFENFVKEESDPEGLLVRMNVYEV